jgi:tRNA-dihydrouridine synthase B
MACLDSVSCERMSQPSLTTQFRIGDVQISNRVLLAPLAGIGNWFVRLQARRHGAGLAVSEMVSSFALHHRNDRTLRELLRIHPGEHPVSIQLFGHDPDVMRSAAAIAADAGADLIDVNMGCPVRKVCKSGAGAALLQRPELALRLARAAAQGSGRPVTVKIRSGLESGDRSGFDLAVRLVEEAGIAGIAMHPRSAAVQHKGSPDYALVRELVERLAGAHVAVIVSGGLDSAEAARRAHRESGADAVMIARGALGNPWIFDQLTGRCAGAHRGSPTRTEIVDELLWTLERAEEHLGPNRAASYARKFYPWYLARLEVRGADADAFQRTESLDQARALLAHINATSLSPRNRGPRPRCSTPASSGEPQALAA